jgi:hypothetical protein
MQASTATFRCGRGPRPKAASCSLRDAAAASISSVGGIAARNCRLISEHERLAMIREAPAACDSSHDRQIRSRLDSLSDRILSSVLKLERA